jgi:hypothetical protein
VRAYGRHSVDEAGADHGAALVRRSTRSVRRPWRSDDPASASRGFGRRQHAFSLLSCLPSHRVRNPVTYHATARRS